MQHTSPLMQWLSENTTQALSWQPNRALSLLMKTHWQHKSRIHITSKEKPSVYQEKNLMPIKWEKSWNWQRTRALRSIRCFQNPSWKNTDYIRADLHVFLLYCVTDHRDKEFGSQNRLSGNHMDLHAALYTVPVRKGGPQFMKRAEIGSDMRNKENTNSFI